jgi:hypothetical protein
VHKLEPVRCTILGFAWKGKPSLLAGETTIAYLIDVINLQQTVRHVTISESAKSLKIQVTKMCVPSPSHAIPLRCQTHGLIDIEVLACKASS